MAEIKVKSYVVSDFGTNCYFVTNADTKEMLIVDPGDNAPMLASNIDKEQLKPMAILLTHGHLDHASAAEELAKIANVDYKEYGLEMLKAGTDLSDYTAQELIALDCKKCELKDKKAKIAQVNTADIPEMMKRKAEFEEAIAKDIEENNLDIFVFAITDIINSNSQAIVLGKATEVFEKGFNTKLEDNTAFLPGVVSRKKQILPVLQENA